MSRMMLAGTGGRELVVTVHTANGTWVAPDTTNLLESLVGEGSDGAPPPVLTASLTVAGGLYHATGGGSTVGTASWSTLQTHANLQLSNAMAGSVAIYQDFIDQYAGTYTETILGPTTTTGNIAGSAALTYTAGWKSRGSIVTPDEGHASLSWDYYGSPSNGSASTGFGYTFAGGIGAPATPVTHNHLSCRPAARSPSHTTNKARQP